MKRVVLWLALIVPEFTRPIAPLPMFPAPWMVLALVKTSVPAPEAPKIKFWLLFDMVSVPEPVSVTLPLIRISVTLPPEFSWIEPVLVMVPARVSAVLLATWTVEELLNPLSVAMLASTKVPLPVSDPPDTLTPFSRVTVEADPAIIVPTPVLVTGSLVRIRFPPDVASKVLVLVVPPLGLIARGVDTLALMVPLFTSTIWPFPMLPAPWMVWVLATVKTSAAAPPKMKFWGLFDIVTVPVPLSATLPLRTSSVAFPPELR